MRYTLRSLVCLLSLFIVASSMTAASGMEATLSWDDGGDSGDPVSGDVGWATAVSFQAPEWANAVVGARCYMGYCSLVWPPEWPHQDSVLPFDVCVWRPSISSPGSPGDMVYAWASCTEWECLEASWVDIRFDEPLSLVDGEQFPDRRFFLGVTWLHRFCPQLTLDVSEPIWEYSWVNDLTGWSGLTGGDLRIQAVVSDTASVPVGEASWGGVKALYQ